MPPLILAGLIGVGLYVGLRFASGVLTGLAGDREVASPSNPDSGDTVPLMAKDLGPLELDPMTGVYRPVRPQ